MADLETLRPEVREAVQELDGKAYPGSRTHERWQIIRTELLRLADENAQLRDVLADRDMDREMAAHANRELASLKARIAEAQECGVVALCGGGASLSHEPYPSLVGKRVRLFVEE